MSKGRRSIPRKLRKPPRHESTPRQRVRTVKETVDVVSYVTGEPRSRVNQFARKLIDDGLLPKSIGRNVKKVGSGAAALLIFAIAHATRTADVTSTAKGFMKLRLCFNDMKHTPDPQNKYDVDICELFEDFQANPKQQLVEVLATLIDQDKDDPWIPVLDISKDVAGRPFVQLHFYYTDEETLPDETRRLQLLFSGYLVQFEAVRVYRLYADVFEKLSFLMTAPDLPDDPSDFDDFLGVDRGDIKDDRARFELMVEEFQDMIDRGEIGDGGQVK